MSPNVVVSLMGPQNTRELNQDFETITKTSPLRKSRRVHGKKVDMGLVAYMASDGTRSFTEVPQISLRGIKEEHFPQTLVIGEDSPKDAFPLLAAIVNLKSGSVELVSKPLESVEFLAWHALTPAQDASIATHLGAYSSGNLAVPSQWKGKGLLDSLILGDTPMASIHPSNEEEEDSQIYWDDAGHEQVGPDFLVLLRQDMEELGPSFASVDSEAPLGGR